MITFPHTPYFTTPYPGQLSIIMMADIARGWAWSNMSPGQTHFLSFAESRENCEAGIYISGLLILRGENGCDFEWIGAKGTEILIASLSESEV